MKTEKELFDDLLKSSKNNTDKKQENPSDKQGDSGMIIGKYVPKTDTNQDSTSKEKK